MCCCARAGANEAEKAKRQYRNLFGGAVIVIFMLVGSMLAVSIAAGEMVKETHVKSATLDDGANNVLKTAPAIEKLPLFAAPVLPLSQLAEIKTLQATIGSSAVKDICAALGLDPSTSGLRVSAASCPLPPALCLLPSSCSSSSSSCVTLLLLLPSSC